MEKRRLSCTSFSPFTTLFTLTLFSSLTSSAFKFTTDDGFVSPLIHRSSPISPFYNPDASPTTLRRATVWTSIARSLYFMLREDSSPKFPYYIDKNSIRSHVLAAAAWRSIARSRYYSELPYLDILRSIEKSSGDFSHLLIKIPAYSIGQYYDYVLKMYIGRKPRLEAYFIPDTGSWLIWLQTTPLYDRAKSWSYLRLRCGTPTCRSFMYTECNSGDVCRYNVEYEDHSSSGEIANEIFMLENKYYPQNLNFSKSIAFACGELNSTTSAPYPASLVGLVGLSKHPNSLVGQIGFSKFSYCISSNRNTSAGHSVMRFGQAAFVSTFNTTPLLTVKAGRYFLNVEDISVAGVHLNISKSLLQMSESGRTGFILDMGTTITVLNSMAFDAVTNMVAKFIRDNNQKDPVKDPLGLYELCYEDVVHAPVVAIVFEQLTFELTQKNTWDEVSPGVHCLAILRGYNVSILGMYQQRDVNVGFDLKNNFVSLNNAVCPLVHDE